jgi:hypothetical protein
MTSHMNVYEPFERKDPTHEDNLTRAFLIVLKSVPAAHAAFLQLADEGHRLNNGDGIPPCMRSPNSPLKRRHHPSARPSSVWFRCC